LSELRKGKHSAVYIFGRYAIKQFDERFEYNFLKEVKFLTLLQPFFFTPKLYFVDFERRRIVMEKIEGRSLKEAFQREVLEKCVEACYILDSLGIEKQEMNHPEKHVIVGEKVYFIDFERARFKKRPSNLTQFCMFLKRFGIYVEKNLLKEYKADMEFEKFLRVKESILKNL